MKRKTKAQSTVEYALIFVAIIAAILIIAKGVFHQRMITVGTDAADTIERSASTLFNQIDSETTR